MLPTLLSLALLSSLPDASATRVSQVRVEAPESERERMQTLMSEQLKLHFRPEFLNRVDEALVFHRLELDHMRAIVHLQLAHLNQLLADRGLQVTATDAAAELLARDGFDPAFGARPLKRTIQRLVQDPLANLVLAGEVGEGQVIRRHVEDGKLLLQPEE